ncbi:MAG TPA: hypothetical protein VLV86_15280 [Vicinamibacterales bacterium]|nr:hypothetical protein [Vicinamibacterales bacterium]
MKPFALALIAIGISAALARPAVAQSKKPSTKYYVTVEGHVTPSSAALEATLTFSGEVQVPGARLPIGTYLFTLVSPTTMRVSTQDGGKVYATFYIVPATRVQNTKGAQIRFERMGDGTTRLIALYPDGATNGYSPLYTKPYVDAGTAVPTAGIE